MLQSLGSQRVGHDLVTEQQWHAQAGGCSLKVSGLGEVTWQMDFLKTVTTESPIQTFLPGDPETMAVEGEGP